jgi:hypothetical protein
MRTWKVMAPLFVATGFVLVACSSSSSTPPSCCSLPSQMGPALCTCNGTYEAGAGNPAMSCVVSATSDGKCTITCTSSVAGTVAFKGASPVSSCNDDGG